MPAPHTQPHQHHTCNQSKEIPRGCCCNNNAWLHPWISSLGVQRETRFLHMWVRLASFGEMRLSSVQTSLALPINIADVPYFRWTNNSRLLALLSAPRLSDCLKLKSSRKEVLSSLFFFAHKFNCEGTRPQYESVQVCVFVLCSSVFIY